MTAVFILPSADRDLGDIYNWIAKDDPQAAEVHVRRLVAAAQRLRHFPERGMARPEIGDGARSLTGRITSTCVGWQKAASRSCAKS